jgi:hypothetical protein
MVKDVKAGKKKKKYIEEEAKQVEENIGEQQDGSSIQAAYERRFNQSH